MMYFYRYTIKMKRYCNPNSVHNAPARITAVFRGGSKEAQAKGLKDDGYDLGDDDDDTFEDDDLNDRDDDDDFDDFDDDDDEKPPHYLHVGVEFNPGRYEKKRLVISV